MVELEHTRELMKSMGLTTASELLDARLEDASHRELTYLDFLGELLDMTTARNQIDRTSSRN